MDLLQIAPLLGGVAWMPIMQLQYDLYQAGKVKRPSIERIAA